jgi:hypothetical protein
MGDAVLVGFDVQLQEEIRPGRLGSRPALRDSLLR